MIVCLLGPAGSGKSTLAKRLQELRPELCARVPGDYFRLIDRDRRWGTRVADRDDHLATTFRQGLAESPACPTSAWMPPPRSTR